MRRTALALLVLLLAACNEGTPATLQQSPTPTPVMTTEAPTPTPTPTPTPKPTPTATKRTTPSPTPTPRRTTARPTPSKAPAGYSVRTVTARDLPYSWRSGCPVGPSQLRMVTVPYLDWNGVKRQGRLVVRASAADAIGRTFVRLYDLRFPIRSIRPVDDFGGSDDKSMAADNTSAFNCRRVKNSSSWSQHSYGLAIDVNPVENPWVNGDEVDPPSGRPYADRSPTRKGMIASGGGVVRAFSSIGWAWGGYWSRTKDYQHFSSNGR